MSMEVMFQALHQFGRLSGKRNVEFKSNIQWDVFLDGFPNLFIRDVKEMAGKDGKLANTESLIIKKASFQDGLLFGLKIGVQCITN